MTIHNSNVFLASLYLADKLDTSLVGEEYLRSPQKRMLDALGTRGVRLATFPINRLTQQIVHLEDQGPPIVTLTRVGKNQEIFMQRKIRSMAVGSEMVDGGAMKKELYDPRLTRVGRFIRKLSIDELPQLDNVLKGEMSLVGPRPKSPREIDDYNQIDPEFGAVYGMALPGLTGLEQISGRAVLSPTDRIDLTRQYAEEASLSMDVDILRKTVKAVVNSNGAY